MTFLAMACGSSAGEKTENEPAPETTFAAELVVRNRSFNNVIVQVCEGETCRRVIGFVGARREGRGVFTYRSDVNLFLEVRYIGQDPGIWRSESLYWIVPGECIEVDIHHYDMRRNNAIGRCPRNEDDGDP